MNETVEILTKIFEEMKKQSNYLKFIEIKLDFILKSKDINIRDGINKE